MILKRADVIEYLKAGKILVFYPPYAPEIVNPRGPIWTVRKVTLDWFLKENLIEKSGPHDNYWKWRKE